MGSVKDLEIINQPTRSSMGVGRFQFSDRYSVFDWGEMPDHIEGKGAALCLMGAYCFEMLQKKEIKTHYRGLISREGRLTTFAELEHPTTVMEVNLVNVFKPEARTEKGKQIYDYSSFTSDLTNFLVPLEIIYRNGLPEGSSIFKRLEEGSVTIKDLGLDHRPKPGEELSQPIFDVSTKLEERDRYVSWKEAQRIAGLSNKELELIKALLVKVDEVITEMARRAGLKNEDGKIELAFDPERKLTVVDVVGTLDECRFTYGKLHVSKEIARQFYRRTAWYKDVEIAKKRGKTEGIRNWKKLVGSSPPRLDPTLKAIMSEMYMAAANGLTQSRMFDVPKLEEVIRKYREYERSHFT